MLGGTPLARTMRFGTVAILGRTNVGKSTFLNAVLGEDLAIISPLPQTTRETLLGVVTLKDAQIAFVDTPGFHQPISELGRRMNQAAMEVVRSTDAVLMMTDPSTRTASAKGRGQAVGAEDRELISRLPPAKSVPSMLVINKVDLLRDKSLLLPLLTEFATLHEFGAYVPASVRQDDGVDRVLSELTALLPEGDAAYPAETLTDRPTRYFVREFIREQVLQATRGEVPHAVAVAIDSYEEGTKLVRIAATIHVEKTGQRKILVGNGGSMIRTIGTAARARIEGLVGVQVHLELFVRVTPRWKDAPRQLAELGYQDARIGAAGEPQKPRGKQE